MGHKYNKFYQPKKTENSENKMEEVFEEVIDDIVIDKTAVLNNEEVEHLTEDDVINVEVNQDKTVVEGIVTNCSRLNVRKEADITSEAIFMLDKETIVNIVLEESTEKFYKVCISDKNIEGYCIKQYIKLK